MSIADKTHELTMLYLSKQDLTDKTPEELVAMYKSVSEEIQNASEDPNYKRQSVRS
ncbi:MAG: hypothetical protein ACOX4I_00840 [Anaerovoracaceae bacterium]|jgi:hypothetical protein